MLAYSELTSCHTSICAFASLRTHSYAWHIPYSSSSTAYGKQSSVIKRTHQSANRMLSSYDGTFLVFAKCPSTFYAAAEVNKEGGDLAAKRGSCRSFSFCMGCCSQETDSFLCGIVAERVLSMIGKKENEKSDVWEDLWCLIGMPANARHHLMIS